MSLLGGRNRRVSWVRGSGAAERIQTVPFLWPRCWLRLGSVASWGLRPTRRRSINSPRCDSQIRNGKEFDSAESDTMSCSEILTNNQQLSRVNLRNHPARFNTTTPPPLPLHQQYFVLLRIS